MRKREDFSHPPGWLWQHTVAPLDCPLQQHLAVRTIRNWKWKYERANYAIRSGINKLLQNNLGRWNLQCARNGVDNRVAHQNATRGTAEGAVRLNESNFHAKIWHRIGLFEKPEGARLNFVRHCTAPAGDVSVWLAPGSPATGKLPD